MQPKQVFTYFDSDPGALAPTRTRLLFAAYINRSPIDSEEVQYRIGPSRYGKFDVLWISSDFDDGDTCNAAAWMPRHQMKGKALQLALLEALFAAEKAEHDLDEPNFSEIEPSPKSALSSSEVRQVVTKIFGSEGR